MKRLLYMLTVVCLSSLLEAGCRKEAKLIPTANPEDVYSGNTLPQGNHSYDTDIKQLFDKYQTLFLYKYVHHDLYYNITDDISGTYDSATNQTTKAGYFDVPADQTYVGVLLDSLKTNWLNYYPDSLLRQGLPQKVFLLDSFYFAYNGSGLPSDNYPTEFDVYTGGDFILSGLASARLTTISDYDKYIWKSQLNAAFLAFAHGKGAIKRSAAFTALTDYSSVNYGNYYSLGIIDYYRSSPEKDWDAYAETIVSNSYATLNSPGYILDPGVDVNGVIRKKYDVMIAYFKSMYGVDLQAIGNAGSF